MTLFYRIYPLKPTLVSAISLCSLCVFWDDVLLKKKRSRRDFTDAKLDRLHDWGELGEQSELSEMKECNLYWGESEADTPCIFYL